ncbi:MAG: cation diffusion facilitator family transporter [Vicinamibacterales bacterium]
MKERAVLSSSRTRHRSVTRVLAVVLAVNVALALAKLLLGYATGAVSIVSDGYHSLTDTASNIMGLIGIRAARKPPDVDHPYGHRKYETLASGAIFVFLLLAVLEIARNAVKHLTAPVNAQASGKSVAVMLAALAVNIAVFRFESKSGRALNSELLIADALHTRSDIVATLGVLVALTGVWLGFPLLDPIGGFAIAVLIAHTGYEIARDASQILSDRVMIDEDDIRHVVMNVPGVLGCHHIRSRGSLDHVFLDLHVWLPADAPLKDAHRVSHVVKDRLMQTYPQIADAVIHIEPPPAQ